MAWTIFAISQMLLITIAVSVGFFLRIRGVQAQNTVLREGLEALEASLESAKADYKKLEDSQKPPEQWAKDQLKGLDKEAPFSALIKCVIEHQLEAKEEFEEEIKNSLQDIEISSDSSDADRIAELEAELAKAQEAQPSGTDENAEDLKQLLQQFTNDSREMMACIQTLEKENAALKERLGEDVEIEASPSEDASEPPAEPSSAEAESDADSPQAEDAEEPPSQNDSDENVAETAASADEEGADTVADASSDEPEADDQDVPAEPEPADTEEIAATNSEADGTESKDDPNKSEDAA